MTATVHGDPQPVSGRYPSTSTDKALAFDGDGDYLTLSGMPTLDGASSFTVEAWVWADPRNEQVPGPRHRRRCWAIGARVVSGSADQEFEGRIDEAVLTAAASSGANVFLPSGTYRISDSLDVPSGILIRGDEGTTIQPLDGEKASPIFWLKDVEGTTIRDLDLRGRSLQNTQTAGHAGVWMVASKRIHLDNLSFSDLGDSIQWTTTVAFTCSWKRRSSPPSATASAVTT